MSKEKNVEPLLFCVSDEGKAIRELLDRVSDKWSILLIVILSRSNNHKARFSELKKSIPDISQKMLTSTLRNLERDGYITREVFPEVPPRVEYELTKLGESLLIPMRGFVDWLEINYQKIKDARNKYDS
ncbi:MAG: helix-turn-helix domain-containing protein [Candidatus Sericytochromatia bacterium]